MFARAQYEELPRRDARRCTERIERTERRCDV
jgi:hypothetical protein